MNELGLCHAPITPVDVTLSSEANMSLILEPMSCNLEKKIIEKQEAIRERRRLHVCDF